MNDAPSDVQHSPPLFAPISLVDFFRYFSREFPYNTGVVSIRAGILKKDSKGWLSEVRSIQSL